MEGSAYVLRDKPDNTLETDAKYEHSAIRGLKGLQTKVCGLHKKSERGIYLDLKQICLQKSAVMDFRPQSFFLLAAMALGTAAFAQETFFEFAITQPGFPPGSKYFPGDLIALAETNSVIPIQIARLGPTNESVTVQIIASNLNATTVHHLQLVDTKLTFGPAETNKSLSVRLLTNTNFLGASKFSLHLSPPNPITSTRSALRVIIYDDQFGFLPPELTFDDRPGYPNKLFMLMSTPPGRYAAERSPDFVHWTFYGEWTATELTSLVFDNPDFPRQFYRVRRLAD